MSEVVREWKRGRMLGRQFEDGHTEVDYVEPNNFGGKKDSVNYQKRMGVEELTRQYLEARKDECFTLEQLYYAIDASRRMEFREYKKRMNWCIWKRVKLVQGYREEGSGLYRNKTKVIRETRGVFQVLQDDAGVMYIADRRFDLSKLEE